MAGGARSRGGTPTTAACGFGTCEEDWMNTKAAVKRQMRRSGGQKTTAAVVLLSAALQFDRRICFLTALLLTTTAHLSAQTVDSLTLRFSGMTAVTGYEQAFS